MFFGVTLPPRCGLLTVDEKCCLPPPAENSIFKTLQKENRDEISFAFKKRKGAHFVAAFCGSQINDPAAVVAAVDPF